MASSSHQTIENEATAVHVVHCFDTLVSHFNGSSSPRPAYDDVSCPLFVTWKKRSRTQSTEEPRLRGCIGTLEPRDLHSSLGKYTFISALQDRRFNPIDAGELEYLDCTVSLLTNFESGLAWNDWEVGTHGMIIEFEDPSSGRSYSATYLPEVAHQQGWTKEECIDSLVQKAGYYGKAEKIRKLVRLTRYQSSLYTLTYQEYLALKGAK